MQHATPYVYLAHPYTDKDRAVMEARFQSANALAAQLMAGGLVVFSPISHSHPIAQVLQNADDGQFYGKQDAPFLDGAAMVVVALVDGWDASNGVKHEVGRAGELGLPVYFLDPSNTEVVARAPAYCRAMMKAASEAAEKAKAKAA